MVVYVEYAFAWNFLLDATLLWLSLRACKRKTQWGWLLFAAALGGAFALLFPLLSLPDFLSVTLKIAVGCLISLTAFGRVKSKKEWGKYALSCVLFFAFTFAFGGGVLALFGERIKKWVLLVLFAFFVAVFLLLIEKIYQKRSVERRVYSCKIAYKQRELRLLGFYDSGNLAQKSGVPVCFLSPDVFYDLWGEEIALGNKEIEGQVCVEIAFTTLGGEKKSKGCLGELTVIEKRGEMMKKQVYFVPSAHMLRREYKLLLNGRIFEGNNGEK